jgi:hypothetical protein
VCGLEQPGFAVPTDREFLFATFFAPESARNHQQKEETHAIPLFVCCRKPDSPCEKIFV